MPFIWDDIVWKLIDDEDSYDKSRFVVVRKLHIKLNTGLWQVVVGIFFIPFQSKKKKIFKKIFFFTSRISSSQSIKSDGIFENMVQ